MAATLQSHPFDVVARVLAERLHRRGPSAELRAAFDSEAVDWKGVIEHASSQYALAAFAAAVRDLGLAAPLEPELREFLEAIHETNTERNVELLDQLLEVVLALKQVGLEPVLLKGAIRLVDGLYPDLGWRMMQDLDILVPADGFWDAIEALGAAGYAPDQHWIKTSAQAPKHHYPGLQHPTRRATVEIHAELFSSAKQRLLRAADVIDRSRSLHAQGVAIRVPLLEHQLVHLIGHCQLSNHGYMYGRIELRDRLEAAALARWSPMNADWNAVVASFAATGCRRPLVTFLMALADGGLCAAPTQVRADGFAALQGRRIALQARSPAAMQTGVHIGKWMLLLKGLVAGRDERSVLLQKLKSARYLAEY